MPEGDVTNWTGRNKNFARATNFLIAGGIILYIISILINLGLFNLQGEESRRAIIAIEMLKSGEYINPSALGWEYYNKPPVFNWILSGIMYLTGSDSEFVLRLPSLFFLLLWAFCHYRVCRKYFPGRLALLSMFFMLTSADLFFYELANGAEMDIFYSFIVYLQVVSIFWFYQEKNWWLLFLFSWFFCGIGFLTKGFPSLVFQGLTLVALSVSAKSIRLLFKPQHLAGIALFGILTGSYFYAYSLKGDLPVMLVNLLNESLKKSAFGEDSTGKFYKILIYPVLLFKLLAPWCLLLLVLFRKQTFRWVDNPFVRFSIFFIVFNIGIYWITGVSKLRYVYMFLPFFINIIVHIYGQFEKENPGLINKYLKPLGILFCLLLAGTVLVPFFFEIGFWMLALVGSLLLCFILFFYRVKEYRIWLLIGGVILFRLVYAVVVIPIQSKSLFDYRPAMAAVAEKTRGHSVHFFLPPDTLKLDIVVGDTLFKWHDKPVLQPPFLLHQVPYYFCRYSGSLLTYDTALLQGQYYISYQSCLKDIAIEQVYLTYYKWAGDSLVLFRPAELPGK